MKFNYLSFLLACCVALSFSSCTINVKHSDDSDKSSKSSKTEKAENDLVSHATVSTQEDTNSDIPLTSFSLQNGVTGTTGSKNCFIPELGAPISFEVTGDGDIIDVIATVTIQHSDKKEIEPLTGPAQLWVSGRDDDNKDVKIILKTDEENQEKLSKWLRAATGTKADIVFKAKLPKKDLIKLNAKQTTNTLVF